MNAFLFIISKPCQTFEPFYSVIFVNVCAHNSLISCGGSTADVYDTATLSIATLSTNLIIVNIGAEKLDIQGVPEKSWFQNC